MRDGDFYTSIGEGHTIAMLLFLRDGPCQFTQLIQFVNNSRTLRNRLERMDLEGLITMTLCSDGHKHFDIALTDIGKDAATKFSIADKLVPGQCLQQKSLDMRHADAILRTMYGRAEVQQKDIMAATRSYDPAVKVLDKMVSEGLVTCTDDRDGHQKLV